MKLIRVKKADNLYDDILDGMSTVNFPEQTKKYYLKKLSDEELNGFEYDLKHATVNIKKLLNYIAEEKKRRMLEKMEK